MVGVDGHRHGGRRARSPVDLPTFSGEGPTDVAANTDEYLADAIASGRDDEATGDT